MGNLRLSHSRISNPKAGLVHPFLDLRHNRLINNKPNHHFSATWGLVLIMHNSNPRLGVLVTLITNPRSEWRKERRRVWQTRSRTGSREGRMRNRVLLLPQEGRLRRQLDRMPRNNRCHSRCHNHTAHSSSHTCNTPTRRDSSTCSRWSVSSRRIASRGPCASWC